MNCNSECPAAAAAAAAHVVRHFSRGRAEDIFQMQHLEQTTQSCEVQTASGLWYPKQIRLRITQSGCSYVRMCMFRWKFQNPIKMQKYLQINIHSQWLV